MRSKPLLRYGAPQGQIHTIANPLDGVEVSGTCGKCKRTVYLKVPPTLAFSFQGCNQAHCPECFPKVDGDPETHWYFK